MTEMAELEPVDLSMARVKEISADWIVHMADYITQNPHFIVNGFVHARITENDVPDRDASSTTSDPGEDENEIVDYIVLSPSHCVPAMLVLLSTHFYCSHFPINSYP